jgi:aminoglycoside phosphotransferase (APT) family kinase protein
MYVECCSIVYDRTHCQQVMEFVKGRIITDPNLSTLSPTERRSAWFSVVSTLAWLHSINPDSIGLSDFGKKTGFYTRHCNTFSRIEAQQAKVKDIKTGKELGRAHPNFDEIVDYIRKNVPNDRTSIVHGDYKFDNVILHPTEPRVIAILDWELSTIGHPLMDAVYVVGPYWNRASSSGISGGPKAQARDDQGGEVYDPENQAQNGMPSMEELMAEYARITGWDPRKDQWEIAKVFHLMRVCLQTLLCSMLVTRFTDINAGQHHFSWHPGKNHFGASKQRVLPHLLRKHEARIERSTRHGTLNERQRATA